MGHPAMPEGPPLKIKIDGSSSYAGRPSSDIKNRRVIPQRGESLLGQPASVYPPAFCISGATLKRITALVSLVTTIPAGLVLGVKVRIVFLPALVDPEPLVGVLANGFFNDIRDYLGIDLDIGS
jgi:hypothetical protein